MYSIEGILISSTCMNPKKGFCSQLSSSIATMCKRTFSVFPLLFPYHVLIKIMPDMLLAFINYLLTD